MGMVEESLRLHVAAVWGWRAGGWRHTGRGYKPLLQKGRGYKPLLPRGRGRRPLLLGVAVGDRSYSRELSGSPG